MSARPFTLGEAQAIADLLRLAPHCHICHVRPATREWSLKPAPYKREHFFACSVCRPDADRKLPGPGQRLSWADAVDALFDRLVAEHPGLYNPDPHGDHRSRPPTLPGFRAQGAV